MDMGMNMPRAVHFKKNRNTTTQLGKDQKIYNLVTQLSRKIGGSKTVYTESNDRLQTFSEVTYTTSVGNAFQGFTEGTANVDTLSSVLVCGLKNIQIWPPRFPDSCGAKS